MTSFFGLNCNESLVLSWPPLKRERFFIKEKILALLIKLKSNFNIIIEYITDSMAFDDCCSTLLCTVMISLIYLGSATNYTAVLRKVVPQKRISTRDNVERYYGFWWLKVS